MALPSAEKNSAEGLFRLHPPVIIGIENDTQHTEGKPPPEGVAPHQTNSGIENDTRQEGVVFNDIRAFALNGNEWQHSLRLLNDKNNITERRILLGDTFNYQLSIVNYQFFHNFARI